jgi:uncharacterized protein
LLDIQATAEGITFWVHVQPRASRAAITGAHENALKIKLTTPPVEGAANKQCIELLAKALSRPKSTLAIISGQMSRHKQIRIQPRGETMDPSESAALRHQLHRLAGQTPQKTP